MGILCLNYPSICVKSITHFDNSSFIKPRSSSSHFHYPSPLKSSNAESETQNRIFILGLGFVGKFFAQELKNQGWVISGTCKNFGKKMELEGRGFDVFSFDANHPEQSTLQAMKDHTHLLVSIPPVVGVGDPMLQHEKLLRTTLQGGNLRWLCYLSSTSVYGDYGGAWVDEDNPTKTSSQPGKLRVAAEEGWLNLGNDLGLSAQVFRLGGIYGPGRSAIDSIIKQGPLSDGQKLRLRRQYTSRVHVQDICQALHASIHKPPPRKVYNIVDDDPAPREEVFSYAWDLVEKKWPGKVKRSYEQPKASIVDGIRRGDKRVSNVLMKRELGVSLHYPSYKLGLQSIIDQMEEPL